MQTILCFHFSDARKKLDFLFPSTHNLFFMLISFFFFLLQQHLKYPMRVAAFMHLRFFIMHISSLSNIVISWFKTISIPRLYELIVGSTGQTVDISP